MTSQAGTIAASEGQHLHTGVARNNLLSRHTHLETFMRLKQSLIIGFTLVISAIALRLLAQEDKAKAPRRKNPTRCRSMLTWSTWRLPLLAPRATSSRT